MYATNTYTMRFANTKDFISNNYCNFKNNKCVAQRTHQKYPRSKENGCCFNGISTCKHLTDGNCYIDCLACKLYSCPYLAQRGIAYWANEIVLLNAFYTKKQRKYVIYDFFHKKEKVLKKINKASKKESG